MSEVVRLSPAPPPRISLDYAALREAGMQRIRALAGETWTDHNAHDPGITLLEALSYAITELGLRIQLDPADLLRSGEAHASAALEPAHRVLPSGPITSGDLHRALLDDPLVADALITTGAEGEVAFYEDPLADPPFNFAPGGPPARARARPRGLFEVVTTFAAESGELNSNTYTVTVVSGGVSRALDLALPHWDEDEATPFRGGASVTAVQMLDLGSGPWRPLDEPQSYFGQLRLDYTMPGGGPQNIVLWVLLRIVEQLEQPAVVLPGILAAAETLVESTSGGSLIDRFAVRVRAAQAAVNRVQRYLAARRNLCEEPVRLAAARVQEIALSARIEVTGGTDLERLLAEVFLAVERLISPPLRFHSLAEMRARNKDVDEIFDGPLLRHGFLDRDELRGLVRPDALYTSDVLGLIMRLRSAAGDDRVAQENPAGRAIVAVTDLRLSSFVNNRPVTTEARDCLRLVETDRYRPRLSLAKSRVVFVRDEVEVDHDRTRVEEMVQQGRQAPLSPDPSPVLPVPLGEVLPVEDYYPFQNDLPPLYGVGVSGVPASASPERRAQALQARAYLHLFEQFLADLTAQLGHVNRFFSPRADEEATYFTRPLFDIPGVDQILTAFAPGGNWSAFVADPDNPHRRALQEAAENRDRFLDRRNRMLDHLLARQGEETVAWGQELHRWARSELAGAGLAPVALAEAMAARRQAVNARLIRDKAAFLAEAPELAAQRLQSFAMPWQRQPEIVRIEPDAGAFRWTVSLDGEDLLRSVAGPGAPPSAPAASIEAEEAVALASQPAFYTVVAVAGGRRYRLQDGAGAGARTIGESPTDFPTVVAAQNAFAAAAARFARRRLEQSLTPLERRIAHLTGIRGRERRRLLVDSGLFFQIDDTVPGDGVVEGWRLRAEPGPAGAVLLTSVAAFTAPTAAEALARARRSIDEAARYGVDEWNYVISPVAGGFALRLHDPAGNPIAQAPAPFTSRQLAEQAVPAAIAHLYRQSSAEGFHLVEHLLLRPRQTGDAFLGLPTGEGGRERDPYSQRLSLVFPSGWARDFAAPPGPAPVATAPHRFRDPEFRRHVQRVVRQACPAHLLPTIHWLHRDLGAAPSPASFDGFEARYFAWLGSVLVPGGAAAAVRAARNDLIGSLNAIGLGAVP